MKALIFLLIAFLVLVYVYTFIKIRKKRKENKFSAVTEFKNKYLKKHTISDNQPNSNYKKQITKYNSKIDYINKDEL